MKYQKLDIQGTVADFEPGNQNREQEPIAQRVAWYYPLFRDGDKPCSSIELDIMHVRAIEPIRITFDSKRNGWLIEQATVFEWGIDEECDEKWKEVAFIDGNGFS